MARMYFCSFILVLFSSQLTAQNISVGDFVIPESRYKNLLGSFQGRYSDTHSGDSYRDGHSKGGNYLVSLNNLFGYNSESTAYEINALLTGAYSHNSSLTDNKVYSPSLQEEKQTREESYFNSHGQYSTYLTPDKIYLYGSAGVTGSFTETRTTTDTNNALFQSNFNKFRAIDGSIGGGIGYGKMREASSVFAVVRIIEKLNEDGYLARELTRKEILDIVNIYARRIEYTSQYDRPTKYFLDDLIQKLETLGVLKGNKASAYEIARVAEVFQENIFPRMVGWTIQAGVVIDRNQMENIYSQSNQSRYFTKTDQNVVTVKAQYGYPFSLSLHWYVNGGVSFPVYGKQNRVGQYAHSALYYQIGEKISNDLNVSFSKNNTYAYANAMDEGWYFSNNLAIGNTFRYFIENNVNLSITVQYNDGLTTEEFPTSTVRLTKGGFNINFGINYRFF